MQVYSQIHATDTFCVRLIPDHYAYENYNNTKLGTFKLYLCNLALWIRFGQT